MSMNKKLSRKQKIKEKIRFINEFNKKLIFTENFEFSMEDVNLGLNKKKMNKIKYGAE